MFFKNAQIFRFLPGFKITAEELEQKLSQFGFNPCGNQDAESIGFVPPRGKKKQGAPLLCAVHGQFLVAVREQKKLLPSAVVKEVADERAEEIKEKEGRRVGRRELRELRELVTAELLPSAFRTNRQVFVWIDPVNGWLAVDAGSRNRADPALELLRKAVEGLPVSMLKAVTPPTVAMAGWLASGEPPAGFTVDRDCEMMSAESAAVRYAHHPLDGEDVRSHIAAGKMPTRLALTWNDRISFVLTDQLEIKRVAFLDIIKEENAQKTDDDEERFELDFTLMTGEFARLLGDLVAALGGECPKD